MLGEKEVKESKKIENRFRQGWSHCVQMIWELTPDTNNLLFYQINLYREILFPTDKSFLLKYFPISLHNMISQAEKGNRMFFSKFNL